MRIIGRVLLVGLIVLAVAAGAFTIWALNGFAAQPAGVAAVQPNATVAVYTRPWLVFEPAASDPTTGLIFYPGARVDTRAYAPVARAIAAEGYLVVIVPMPLNLALFDPNAAAEVIAAYPEIQFWAVGGHSLGGAMAAQFAAEQPGQVEGLALWAAYPLNDANLADSGLEVVSITAANDAIINRGRYEAGRAYLPADTTFVTIAGGNHAGFGVYGPQPGDGVATISPDEQQEQAVAATVELLESLDE